MQKLTDQDTINILAAFPTWISQRSGLEFANYGEMKSFSADSRRIAKDRKRAKIALQHALDFTPNPEAMEQALTSYSGRLEWNGDRFEYCTGQYFPMEFAAAAAAVLESYIDLVRPKHTPSPSASFRTIHDIKAANYAAGGKWFDKGNMRFFRSRVLPMVFSGKGGIFFVSSECSPDQDRKFTVRQFIPVSADIRTYGAFNTYDRPRAVSLAKLAASGEIAEPQ